jgi:archaea-specific DNA-binding protein
MNKEEKPKEHKETKEVKERKPRDKSDENVIYVGSKPPMNYVTAIIAQFNSSGSNEVTLKARGGAISRAVDAAEITRNRFMTGLKIKSIIIGTEVLTNEEGRTSNVSSIEIILTK